MWREGNERKAEGERVTMGREKDTLYPAPSIGFSLDRDAESRTTIMAALSCILNLD